MFLVVRQLMVLDSFPAISPTNTQTSVHNRKIRGSKKTVPLLHLYSS